MSKSVFIRRSNHAAQQSHSTRPIKVAGVFKVQHCSCYLLDLGVLFTPSEPQLWHIFLPRGRTSGQFYFMNVHNYDKIARSIELIIFLWQICLECLGVLDLTGAKITQDCGPNLANLHLFSIYHCILKRILILNCKFR